MKKLFRFLSLALCTICLTMTATLAVKPTKFPTYTDASQFMNTDFAIRFAIKLSKYSEYLCELEEAGILEDCFLNVKHRIKKLISDLEKEDHKAALRLTVAICQISLHAGHINVSESESFSSYEISESTKTTDPHRSLRLILYKEKEGKQVLAGAAVIKYKS